MRKLKLFLAVLSMFAVSFAWAQNITVKGTVTDQSGVLARKKNEGAVLGRPKGSRSTRTKLSGKEERIKEMLQEGISKSAIARRMKVSRITLLTFIKKNGLTIQ